MRSAACAFALVWVLIASSGPRSASRGACPNVVEPATQPATAPSTPFPVIYLDDKAPRDRRNIDERAVKGAPALDAGDEPVWFAFVTRVTPEKRGPGRAFRVAYYLNPTEQTPRLRKGTFVEVRHGPGRAVAPKRGRYVQVSRADRPFARELSVPKGTERDLMPFPAPVLRRRDATGVWTMNGPLGIADDELVQVIDTTRVELAKDGLKDIDLIQTVYGDEHDDWLFVDTGLLFEDRRHFNVQFRKVNGTYRFQSIGEWFN